MAFHLLLSPHMACLAMQCMWANGPTMVFEWVQWSGVKHCHVPHCSDPHRQTLIWKHIWTHFKSEHMLSTTFAFFAWKWLILLCCDQTCCGQIHLILDVNKNERLFKCGRFACVHSKLGFSEFLVLENKTLEILTRQKSYPVVECK